MFSHLAREFRHNPCLMGPLTFSGMLIVCLLWIVALLWKFPAFMLGYLIGPLLNRTQFIIEFIYPLGLGRMVHLTICRLIQRTGVRGSKPLDKNRGYHSRSVETRIEVIPDRLYIHPLPQLIDNLGYLVVCIPDDEEFTMSDSSPLGQISTITQQHITPAKIVAFMVDCGDADAVMEQLNIISEIHYQSKTIHVQSILSTHKHHDHTAGNIPFSKNKANLNGFKIVVGGAVEKVPGCNYTVANGDMLPLPFYGSNKMEDFIEVEAIATPAHTRGSVTYAFRVKPEHRSKSSPWVFLFTGDTMFSAGGGVPFEADLDPGQEQNEQKKTFISIIKASASLYAVERCFGEILARALRSQCFTENMGEKVFIMPGHEYTHELLARQLAAGNATENCRWKNFPPNVFFETASQLYVALHRRSLPLSSGKLITAMASPVSLELIINPYFRTMKRRGDIIIQAITFWHQHFARNKIPRKLPSSNHILSTNGHNNGFSSSMMDQAFSRNAASNENQWTLNATDLALPVFTTVYSSDLDSVIRDLDQGIITSQEGARRLLELKERLKHGLISRRPVPASLPSDRAVYRGLLALALLGSSPTALTLSDSVRMNLPKPVVGSSDQIKISRTHLVSVLQWLGLLTEERNGRQTVAMIHQLWKEATEDSPTTGQINKAPNYDTIDPEVNPQDFVDLGDLKWQIYGVPRRQAALTYCLPCANPIRVDSDHPAYNTRMQPHSGEIVRHDVMTCPICRTRAGCPHLSADTVEDQEVDEVTNQSSGQVYASNGDEDEGICVEVASVLREL